MPTVTVFPTALTSVGTPRTSASVTYNGAHDKTVKLQLVSPTWATDDPTINVTMAVEVSFDGGTSWTNFCTMTTQPRSFAYRGGLPSLNCTAGDDRGPRLARAVLSVDKLSLTVGMTATT